MADGYDRYDNEGTGGGSFVMGLLTGTVLGAGLGMLFAPRAGSELRGQLSEQAGSIANTASEGVRRASEAGKDWAGRGRDMYDKARDAMSKGVDEANRYAREAGIGTPGTSGTGGAGSVSSTGSGFGTTSTPGSPTSDSIRGRDAGGSAWGTGSEQTRGSGSSGINPGSQSNPPGGGTRRS